MWTQMCASFLISLLWEKRAVKCKVYNLFTALVGFQSCCWHPHITIASYQQVQLSLPGCEGALVANLALNNISCLAMHMVGNIDPGMKKLKRGQLKERDN